MTEDLGILPTREAFENARPGNWMYENGHHSKTCAFHVLSDHVDNNNIAINQIPQIVNTVYK